MARYRTRQDVGSKVDWEGGLVEALDYGIKADDMPEGDTELIEAWTELQAAHAVLEKAAEKVTALLWPGEPEGE
jgi:hypothetical protein